MSVTLTPVTMVPARMVWPPLPASVSQATQAITVRPTLMSVTANRAAMGAPARIVTTPTSACASREPQVTGQSQQWVEKDEASLEADYMPHCP